ncbi:hypothetical protein KGQ19_30950 [Catenulispora sp. NL8]|uniref:MFS transporter n=1 Tax=Catenulispora pinistramenti TaxID=2705254 RepID=A0ABS5KZF7_9ACTN|nr:hypothetical protein [Catenulispora pinistramenti]MBS2551295.1 hypothetical protein [Catenulispora pinistramenti]
MAGQEPADRRRHHAGAAAGHDVDRRADRAAASGARPAPRNPLRAIGWFQVLAGLGFLGFLAVPHTAVIAAGVLAVGVFATPMTVWAQSVRMQRIPPELRGRGFATLRTLMLVTPPIGAGLAGPLLAAGRPGAAAVGMTTLAAVPGVVLSVLFWRKAEVARPSRVGPACAPIVGTPPSESALDSPILDL